MTNIIDTILRFDEVEQYATPYTHFTVRKVLSDDMAERILCWLESSEEYVLRDEPKNRQYGFYLSSENVPRQLQDFFGDGNLQAFKSRIEDVFGIKFQNRFLCSANVYMPGQGTLIHTDFMEPELRNDMFFTHRFLLYLNRQWEKSDGGVLGIFQGEDPSSLARTVSPVHNSGAGLAFSKRSFHAVSEVKAGRRYTLNFAFLSSDGRCEGESDQ